MSPAQIEDLICARERHEQRQYNRQVRLLVWAMEHACYRIAWSILNGTNAAIVASKGGNPSYEPKFSTEEQLMKRVRSAPGYKEKADRRR